MSRVKSQLQKRIGRGKSEVIPSPMPRPRKTPEALITTGSVKAKLLDLARRRALANGNSLLMPQAESVVIEDAGGLGYAAPTTAGGNYALSLPSAVGTTDANKAARRAHKRVPPVTRQSDETVGLNGMKEDVITSLDQLRPLFEAYSPGYTLPIRVQKQPDTVGGKYRKTQVSKATAMAGAADDAGILEDLKVGEGQDNSPESEGKSRVRRKYLGTKRGRTATGKSAHAIEVMPVLQRPDRNVNKTTPGSPLKRTT